MSIKFKADRSDLFFFHQFVVGDNTSKMFAVKCLPRLISLALAGSASWFQENIEETNCWQNINAFYQRLSRWIFEVTESILYLPNSCMARLPFEFRVALSIPVSAPHTVYISVCFPLTISMKLQTTLLTSSCGFQTPTCPHFFILYAQKSPKGTFKWLHGGFSHYWLQMRL